jgi:carbon storage regulator CsrA
MLVLSRKVGEQVILPDCGVTVEVVAVSGKRVRLGFAAPSGTRVHRTEIWQRICQADGNGSKEDGPTQSENRGRRKTNGEDLERPPLSAAEGEEFCGLEPEPGNLDASLARWIARRTGGRIRSLSVKSLDDRLLICGSTGSYYARQLAQAAVGEMLGALGSASPREVEFSIDVDGTEIGTGGRTVDE